MKKIETLARLFENGTISRRDFISRMAALGMTAALSPSLFAGSARAATPQKGGRLIIGSSSANTSDSLDPATINNNMPLHVLWQATNNLVEIDHRNQAVPELAESIEPSADAKTWTVTLRKGVEFHNGKSFTADDALFSINRHRAEGSKSVAKGLLKPVQELKKDGPYTLVITLAEGNADFPFLLADHHLQMVPEGTTDFNKGIGTGGYIIQKWEPGVRALAKRNPNYWKQGSAHFDEVETLGINDVNARTSALKTKQIHVMDRCDFKTFHLLEKMPGINAIRINGGQHFALPMLTDRKPFDNNDVRLALKYAIDRQQILDKVLRGYGVVGNDHPISPASRYYAKDLPQRPYDPEKAKYHMKKAGYLDHTFKLHAADAAFEGAVDTAILYREHAAKAGIKIDVVREPNDGYWSNVWMKKDWCFCYWNGRPTEDWTLSLAYAAESSWNDSFWKHQKFNEVLVAARSELDTGKRRQMYGELQQILSDEGGTVIPFFADHLIAATDNLKYGAPASNTTMDGMKLSERWWFA